MSDIPERGRREGDQPLPVTNNGPCIQDLVIADIETRKAVGLRRYGTVLQPHNGRNALLDAYEEAIDLAVYLRQLLYERRALIGAITRYMEVVGAADTWHDEVVSKAWCAELLVAETALKEVLK